MGPDAMSRPIFCSFPQHDSDGKEAQLDGYRLKSTK